MATDALPRRGAEQQGSAGAPAAAVLLAAAAQGDQRAWDAIVDRYGGLVWAVARSHRLDRADAGDVAQTVWLRLVENLGRIRDPDRLAGWLATTARHECLRLLRRSGREAPHSSESPDEATPPEDSPEWQVLASERRRVVAAAVAGLTPRCRDLLRILSASPDLSYAEVSAALGMPVGSIGPTRARCLEHLRRRLVRDGLLPQSDGERGGGPA